MLEVIFMKKQRVIFIVNKIFFRRLFFKSSIKRNACVMNKLSLKTICAYNVSNFSGLDKSCLPQDLNNEFIKRERWDYIVELNRQIITYSIDKSVKKIEDDDFCSVIRFDVYDEDMGDFIDEIVDKVKVKYPYPIYIYSIYNEFISKSTIFIFNSWEECRTRVKYKRNDGLSFTEAYSKFHI